MRSVIQRVSSASVTIDNVVAAEIGQGMLALVGMAEKDHAATIDYMIEKMINLRIFEDGAGKMNLSLCDIAGKIIFVPNFTLYGDARKGRRPSFVAGAAPEQARGLFAKLAERAAVLYPRDRIGFGVFQADMKVALVNDGPVTLLMDSERLF